MNTAHLSTSPAGNSAKVLVLAKLYLAQLWKTMYHVIVYSNYTMFIEKTTRFEQTLTWIFHRRASVA